MSSKNSALKTCKKCGNPKTPNDFYKHNKSTCKECIKEASKKYKTKRRAKGHSRHEEYRRQAIKDGSMTRAGIAYILTAPLDNIRWCIHCKKYIPIENFRKTKTKHSRFDNIDYYETACKKHSYTPHPRPKRTEEEEKIFQENIWIHQFLKRYFMGDGCCLYCGKTDFWVLSNHHPWKKIDPDFTITLCENHHAFCTRILLFLLEDWY